MTTPRFRVIVPARWASSRLPGKPLADLGGKPMVVHVAERARQSGAHSVHVATDDARIAQAARAHGLAVVMTRGDHHSGTDRLAEAAELLGLAADEIVVNVQGDEPFIEPGLIRSTAALIEGTPEAAIATACHPIVDAREFFDPNTVKVVLDAQGFARYFSRAPVPWDRDAFAATGGAAGKRLSAQLPAFRHIGIYAYRVHFIESYPALAPSPLEQAEKLEQLRALWHGFAIAVSVRPDAPLPGIDTPADLDRARQRIAARQSVRRAPD